MNDQSDRDDCNSRDFPRRRVMETSIAQESKALHAALPERRVISRRGHKFSYVLECGHVAGTGFELVPGTSVPCLLCYKSAMAQAEKMLEQ